MTASSKRTLKIVEVGVVGEGTFDPCLDLVAFFCQHEIPWWGLKSTWLSPEFHETTWTPTDTLCFEPFWGTRSWFLWTWTRVFGKIPSFLTANIVDVRNLKIVDRKKKELNPKIAGALSVGEYVDDWDISKNFNRAQTPKFVDRNFPHETSAFTMSSQTSSPSPALGHQTREIQDVGLAQVGS